LVKIFNQEVDLFILANILSQNPEKSSFSNIQQNSINILLYNASMFLVAGVSGYSLKKVVRKQKWDRLNKLCIKR
jgi:hypothetical protein